MKKLIKLASILSIFLAVLLLSNILYAECKVQGIIINSNSEVIKGAKLVVYDESNKFFQEKYSGWDGKFELKLKEGKFNLLVNYDSKVVIENFEIRKKDKDLFKKIMIKESGWGKHISTLIGSIIAAVVGFLSAYFKIRIEKSKNLNIYKNNFLLNLRIIFDKIAKEIHFLQEEQTFAFTIENKERIWSDLNEYFGESKRFIEMYENTYREIFAQYLPDYFTKILDFKMTLSKIEKICLNEDFRWIENEEEAKNLKKYVEKARLIFA